MGRGGLTAAINHGRWLPPNISRVPGGPPPPPVPLLSPSAHPQLFSRKPAHAVPPQIRPQVRRGPNDWWHCVQRVRRDLCRSLDLRVGGGECVALLSSNCLPRRATPRHVVFTRSDTPPGADPPLNLSLPLVLDVLSWVSRAAVHGQSGEQWPVLVCSAPPTPIVQLLCSKATHDTPRGYVSEGGGGSSMAGR